jgi:hypothetical protein
VSEATPEDVLHAFHDRIYGIAGPVPVRRDNGSIGWSAGRETLESIELWHDVGARRYRVGVETRRAVGEESSGLASRHRALTILSLDLDNHYPHRFPAKLMLRHFKHPIPVDGRPTRFTALTCGRAAIAYCTIDGHELFLRFPAALLRRLSLRTEPPSELRSYLTAFFRQVNRGTRSDRAAVPASN